MVRVDDLVDAQQIADRLKLAQRSSVSNLVLRYEDFPDPLGMWGRTRLWDWNDVEVWARAHGRYAD